MKKIIIFNLFFVFILIVLFEIILRTIFNINVQGISKNLLNKNINYTFNQPNLKNGLAFGANVDCFLTGDPVGFLAAITFPLIFKILVFSGLIIDCE